MKKIWEKDSSNSAMKLVDTYCFLEGVQFDNQLVLYDVIGSIAHMQMLESIGILSKKETAQLFTGLSEIIELHRKNNFAVSAQDEDVHTKVEAYLTQKLGDVAKKIHTGRSRNDQVALDLRLYAKDKTSEVASGMIQAIQGFITYAKKYEYVPMPGYTHMQKAMPSSVGLWSMSLAESFIDDLALLKGAYEMNDKSPLGSGAAFGVSLPINRELTAQLLGFSSVLNNAMYCQSSRPKVQLALMQVLAQAMISASKFASDLLLFSTSEFNFFSVGDGISTGSSIMPQKKNLDLLEYMRAKTHTVIANQQMVASICVGIPSGYNADFGQTKKPFMESVEIVIQTMQIIVAVLDQIKPNIDILTSACTSELYATHAAYEQVKKGVPFRAAYQNVGANLDKIENYDPIAVLKLTNHTGAPGNIGIAKKEKELSKAIAWWDKKKNDFTRVINTLLQQS